MQIDEIRAAGQPRCWRPGPLPATTLLAMGEVTAGLAARQQEARDAFEKRFAASPARRGNGT